MATETKDEAELKQLQPVDDAADDKKDTADDGDDEYDADEWEYDPPIPPDGGWGWVVMFSCFLSNVIVDGVCYSYSVFFAELTVYFGASSSKTALVGALVPAFYLLVGPIVSAMANKIGLRAVTIIGSVVASAFFVISSFSTTINMMLVTYGIMGGAGFGFMYLPSIVMVGYYFDKRRALATGVSVCGAGIGTFVFAPLCTFLVENYGWKGANIIIGAIILNGIVFGLTYRPLKPRRRRRDNMIIMKKIAAEKRMRTYSVDDQVLAKEREQNAADTAVPTITLTTASQTHLQVPGQPPPGLSLTTASQASLHRRTHQSSSSISAKKDAAASPFARADILYTGSIQNTAEFQAAGDMKTYISSVRDMATASAAAATGKSQQSIVIEEAKPSFFAPMKRVLFEMFDFSLLKTVAFVPILAAGVLGWFGLYTPFVYVTQKAINELDVTPSNAALILSVLGACSTVSRIVTGLLADVPRIDCLILHNGAAILAGLATCTVSVLNSYALLMAYGAIFGIFSATFIALRSIVLVEVLGIQKLTNAFGITVLFQGFAVLAGSPLSGAILDATGSYVYPFLVSGSCMALAGVVCLPVRRIAAWEAARAARLKPSSDNNDNVHA